MLAAKASLRAAEVEAAWLAEGPRSVSVDFGNGVTEVFTFTNVMINGKRYQRCNLEGCSAPYIGVTGDQHARQHALAKHRPETALAAAARRKSLGGGTWTQRALQLAPNESALLAVNQGGKVSASQVKALTTSGVLK